MEIKINCFEKTTLLNHFLKCNDSFVPKLTSYVDLPQYIDKIHAQAVIYGIMRSKFLLACLAIYKSNGQKTAFITNLSVVPGLHGRGLSSRLLVKAVKDLENEKIQFLNLEVFKNNYKAQNFYLKQGFKFISEIEGKYLMQKEILDKK